jgi:hypothetical protein
MPEVRLIGMNLNRKRKIYCLKPVYLDRRDKLTIKGG